MGQLVQGDGERRQQAHDLVGGGDGDEAQAVQRLDELRAAAMQADARQQPLAAHLGHQLRMRLGDRAEALVQDLAAFAHPGEKAVLQHDVQNGVRHRAGERVAAEGRAVGARGHGGSSGGGGEAGADREPAAQTLGDGRDVGTHAGLFAGEQRPRAAHAGLDLVEDQEQAMLVAQGAEPLQALGRHRADAAFPLDRLDHDGAGRGADGGVQRLVVAERNDVEPGQQRVESLDHLLAADGGNSGHGPAMERTLEGDDPVAFRIAARPVEATGHLDAGFDRLRTGIAHEHGVGESLRHQPVRQPLELGDLEQVGHVPQLACLLRDRPDQMRMRVAEACHRDAGGEIEHAAAVGRVQPCTLTAREGEIVAPVDG